MTTYFKKTPRYYVCSNGRLQNHKRTLDANIFRTVKVHVHSNKINENADMIRYSDYRNEAYKQLAILDEKEKFLRANSG